MLRCKADFLMLCQGCRCSRDQHPTVFLVYPSINKPPAPQLDFLALHRSLTVSSNHDGRIAKRPDRHRFHDDLVELWPPPT